MNLTENVSCKFTRKGSVKMKVPINLKSFKKVLRNFNHFSNGFLEGEIELDLPDQKQVDWNQTDNTQVDFIKNKPTIITTDDFMKELWSGEHKINDGVLEIPDFFNYRFFNLVYSSPNIMDSVILPTRWYDGSGGANFSYGSQNLNDTTGNGLTIFEGRILIQKKDPLGTAEFLVNTEYAVDKPNNSTTFSRQENMNIICIRNIIGISKIN